MNRFKKRFSLLLSVVLIFTMLPAVYAQGEGDGYCPHHTAHDESCGYAEAVEAGVCTHECGEECYAEYCECVHAHTAECYSAAEDGEEALLLCTHICTAETGCISLKPLCTHAHDENCGYAEAIEGSACTFECSECAEEKPEAGPEQSPDPSKAPETKPEPSDKPEAMPSPSDEPGENPPEKCAHGNEGECSLCTLQSLIDAIPAADEISKENAEAVMLQVAAVDEAMLGADLTDEDMAELDTVRYDEAVLKLNMMKAEAEKPISSQPLDIGIRMKGGRTLALTLMTDDTIGDIKHEIFMQTGVAEDKQKLMLGESVPADADEIQMHLSADNNTLDLIISADYIDEAGILKTAEDVTALTADMNELAGGWYFISEACSPMILNISDSVKLILTDKEFSAAAVMLDPQAELTVYGSSADSAGTIKAVSVKIGSGTLDGRAALNMYSGKMMINGAVSGALDMNVLQGMIKISGGAITGTATLGEKAEAELSGGVFAKLTAAKTLDTYLADGYVYKSETAYCDGSGVNELSSVTVTSAPVKITAQPEGKIISRGETAVLSVSAETKGKDSVAEYLWYKDGVAIEGAAEASYTTPNDLENGEHEYFCAVSCEGISVTSEKAKVTVIPAAPVNVRGGRCSITGVDDTMEYCVAGSESFSPVAAGEIEIKNLAPGYYDVRYMQGSDYSASKAVTVLVFDEDGNFTQTQTMPDGSRQEMRITEDGSSTVTTDSADGKNTTIIRKGPDGKIISRTEIVTKEDGSKVATETQADGTKIVTQYDKDGKVTERITYYPDGSYVKDGYTPKLVEGDGAVYNGSRIVFRSDDELKNFKSFKVDGRIVHSDYYTVESGSIKVTAYTSLFRRLAAGTHTVSIESANGEAAGTFTIPRKTSTGVATGDTSNVILFACAMAVSAAGIAAVAIYWKKKK